MLRVTLVTAYHQIEKAKHTSQDYQKWIGYFLLLPQPMVIYTNQFNMIEQMAQDKLATGLLRIIPDSQKNGWFTHKYDWHSQKKLDPEKKIHHPDLYQIWNEKTFWVMRTIQDNPFHTDFFYWVDIGCFRSIKRVEKYQYFPITLQPKITLLQIHPFIKSERTKIKQVKTKNKTLRNPFLRKDRIGGGIFGGHRYYWQKWALAYESVLDQLVKHKEFIGKDQSIMALVALLYPDLVHSISIPKKINSHRWFYLQAYLSRIPEWFIVFWSSTANNSDSSPPWKNLNWSKIDYHLLPLTPKIKFVADPFIWIHNQSLWIFYEQFHSDTRKGTIACSRWDQTNKLFVQTQTILSKPYHLSYPFIFKHAGTIYMIPESYQNKTIQLFRCVKFPSKWRLDTILIRNINAVDSTLVQYHDKYWLFTSVKKKSKQKNRIRHRNLTIFWSDSLTGPWHRHPIIIYKNSARPAGRIFEWQGKLIRPGQWFDPQKRIYGEKIIFHQIVTLTTTEFQEVELDRLEPNWFPNIQCNHTFNIMGQFGVLDASGLKRMRPK